MRTTTELGKFGESVLFRICPWFVFTRIEYDLQQNFADLICRKSHLSRLQKTTLVTDKLKE